MGVCVLGVGAVQAQQPLAPGASLPTVDAPLQRVEDGTTVRLQALTGSTATVILFWSNRCPWIDRYEERVQQLVSAFRDRGVRFVRVNANDASEWPNESLASSRARADRQGYAMSYLRDPRAALARALGATRTPHAFVFDAEGTLVYVGGIDDSPGDPNRVQTPHLRNVLDALVNGTSPAVSQTRAFGCTLKYPE